MTFKYLTHFVPVHMLVDDGGLILDLNRHIGFAAAHPHTTGIHDLNVLPIGLSHLCQKGVHDLPGSGGNPAGPHVDCNLDRCTPFSKSGGLFCLLLDLFQVFIRQFRHV